MEIKEIIFQGLGEASALFMSQGKTPAENIIMPSEELTKIGERMMKEIKDSHPKL